ncbi:dihydrodipicolinate reductase [Mycolicibacterium rhodesiae JS60]|nr:dihydrodipicolinate reductase [Mycolicibacterium rhodesiae JS60]
MMARLRVGQWSLGHVGRHALSAIIAHPALELVAAWSHSPGNSGIDASMLCDAKTATGVPVTSDVDQFIGQELDCVVYAAIGETRPREAVNELVRLLAAGINVVSVSMIDLIHPGSAHPKAVNRLQAACLEGRASLFTTGLDPGFTLDALPISAVQLCRRVRTVRVQELGLYGDHPDPGWGTPYGFGLPAGAPAPILDHGAPTRYWGGVVRALAEMLGIELDGLEETVARCYADEAFDVPIGHMAKDSLVGVRFQVAGVSRGQPRVVADHVTRIHPDVAPQWPQPGMGRRALYRITIEGEPNLVLEMTLGGEGSGIDYNEATLVATAARAVNAVPAVVATPPGIVTFADLGLNGIASGRISSG